MFRSKNLFQKKTFELIVSPTITNNMSKTELEMVKRFQNVSSSFVCETANMRALPEFKKPLITESKILGTSYPYKALYKQNHNQKGFIKAEHLSTITKRTFSSTKTQNKNNPSSLLSISNLGKVAHVIYQNPKKSNPEIMLSEIDSQTPLASFKGPKSAITNLCFSSNGRYLVAGTAFDAKVYVWDITSPENPQIIPHNGTNAIVSCNADATIFAIAYQKDENNKPKYGLEIIKLTDNKTVNFEMVGFDGLALSPNYYTCLEFSPNNTTLVASQQSIQPNGGRLSFYSLEILDTGKKNAPIKKVTCGGLDSAVALTFDSFGDRLAGVCSSRDASTHFTSIGFSLKLSGNIMDVKKFGISGDDSSTSHCVAFSPNGKIIATGGMYLIANKKERRSVVRLWDLEGNLINMEKITDPKTPGFLGEIGFPTFYITFLDDSRIISANQFGTVRECDIEGKNGVEIAKYKTLTNTIYYCPKNENPIPHKNLNEEPSFKKTKKIQ